VACEAIREHPWLGVGPGGFGEVFPRYRRHGDNESQHVHALPLELAAELGLPLALLLVPLFFVVFVGRAVARRERDGPAWHRGVAIGLAAFAIQNLADFTAFFPSTLLTACLLWGVTSARRFPGEAGEQRSSGGLAHVALAGTIVAALVVALAGLATNARIGARNAAAGGEREAASALAQRAARLAPWDVDCRMLKVQAVLDDPTEPGEGRSKLERALLDAERAVELAPIRPAARDLRSRIRLALGDLPGGYADLAEAARLYPLRTEYATRRDAALQLLPEAPRDTGEQ
jgi:hypothetical protein